MDKSVFSNTIKTYPSKTNRISRTYSHRPSTMAPSMFGNTESEEMFDKLLGEEKQKPDLMKRFIDDVAEEKHKNYGSKCSTTLKNIQNVNGDGTRRIHQTSIQPHKNKNSKYSCLDKENTLKLSSRLFFSDSDTSNNSLNFSVYQYYSCDFNHASVDEKRRYSKFKLQKPKTISKPKPKKINRKKRRLIQNRRIFSNLEPSEAVSTAEKSPISVKTSDIPIIKINDSTFSVDEVAASSVTTSSSFSPKMKVRDRLCSTLFSSSYTEISKIIRPSELRANSSDNYSTIRSFEKDSQIRVSNASDFTFGKLSFQFKPKGMSTPESHRRMSTVSKCSSKPSETIICSETNPKFISPNHPVKVCTDSKFFNKSSVSEGVDSEKLPVQDNVPKSDVSTNAVEECLPPKTDVSCDLRDTNVEQCDIPVSSGVETDICESSTEDRILERKSVNRISDSVDFVCREISQLTFQPADGYITPKTVQPLSSAVLLHSELTNDENLVSSLQDFHLTAQERCSVEDLAASVSSCPSVYTDSLLETVVAKNTSHCETVSEASTANSSKSSRSNDSFTFCVHVEPPESKKNISNADLSSTYAEISDSKELTVINRKYEELSPNLVKNADNSILEETLSNEISKSYESRITEVETSITSTFQSESSALVDDLQRSEESDSSVLTNAEKSVRVESSSSSEFLQPSVLTDSVIANDVELTHRDTKEAHSCNISTEVNLSASMNFYGFGNEATIISNEKLHIMRGIVEELGEKKADSNLSSLSTSCESSLSRTVISRSQTDESGDNDETYKFVRCSPEKEVAEKYFKKSEMMKITDCERYRKNLSGNRQKFETVVEENGEDEVEDIMPLVETKNRGCAPLPSIYGNFTERRRKPYLLPPLMEEETEKTVSYSQDSGFDRSSVCVNEGSTVRQSLYLSKGKKWRRSFIALKNIRDFGLSRETLENENKGRSYKQNIENLICSQQNFGTTLKEIEECSFMRTGFDSQLTSGFDEGDASETCSHFERARFSLCVRANPVSNDDITLTSFVSERTLAWFMNESSQSALHDFDVPAGDISRDLSIPFIDYGIPHSAKEITLHYCKQSEPLPFEECFPESVLQNCEKIGEGVYGEVFMLKKRSRQKSVLKIIPIEGDQLVNGERQKKFDEILSELVITFELSNLKNRSDYYTNCFAEVQQCHCVYGKYPPRLLALWKEYDMKKGSDNDSPKIFKSDQLYVILELNNGGKDLESSEFSNALQALSVFNQVAYALAVAEQAFMFEHRDLHWGNILVSNTQREETTFILNKKKRNVKLHGVKVTIIDYTLSRISIKNRTLYNNIGQDPELFTAEGDFQFEVYRLMKEEVKNIWDQFAPKTNILWLYYLLDKLINEVRYRMNNTRNNIKIHNQNLKKLKELYEVVMKCASSYDLIEGR